MIIEINDKKTWGQLLEVYRELSGKSINSFIKKSNKDICSKITYSKIINDPECVDNKTYFKFFEAKGIPLYTNKVNLDFLKIHHNFEYYDYDHSLIDLKEIESKFLPIAKCAYYDLIQRSIKIIKCYLENNMSVTAKDLEDVLVYEKLLPNQLRDVLCYCAIALSNKITIENYKEYNTKLSCISKYLPLQLQRITSLANFGEFKKAYDSIEILEPQLSLTNYSMNINFYYLKFGAANKIKYNENECYREFIEYFNKHNDKLSLRRKEVIVGNMVIGNLLKKEYNNCLELLKTIIYEAKFRKIQLTIFSLFCHSQLDLIAEDDLYNIDLSSCCDSSDLAMIKYFIDKKVITNTEKKKTLILTEERLRDSENVYKFIIKEELYKLERMMLRV